MCIKRGFDAKHWQGFSILFVYHTFMIDSTLLIIVILTIFQSVSTFLQIDSAFQTPASQPLIFSLLLEIRV